MNERQTLKVLVFPFKVIVSPLKAFREITQNPSIKGLLFVLALIMTATAGAQYVSATKIYLNVGEQRTSFLLTGGLSGWVLSALTETAFFFLIYWFIYSGAVFLLSKLFGGKERSWRVFFVVLGYAFSVTIILWVVRALVFATLPELYFDKLNYWPPMREDYLNLALPVFNEKWAPLPAYQSLAFLNIVFGAWLVLLGTIAVRTLREITWEKAILVSLVGYIINLFLLGTFMAV